MCMMESTYAIANSIAGVSGSENVDNKEIVTVPGTNIQSDETPEFDVILKRQKPDCRSILEELKAQMPDAEIRYAYGYPIAGADQSGYARALEIAEDADIVILTLGGKHGTCSMASMGEGVDATNINLPECQDAFIRKAAKLGKPLIGVHFDGRPISSDAADAHLDAILEAWNPSEMGAVEVEAFLTHLAVEGNVAASTQNQARSALLFLYKEVLGSELPWLNNVEQARKPRRLPVVLTEDEVRDVLASAPAGPFDLVSCRNLLIYLQPAQQTQLLQSIHSVLRPGGWLFISTVESLDSASLQRFQPVPGAAQHHLYQRRHAAHA